MNRLCGACGETHASPAEAHACMTTHSDRRQVTAYEKRLADFILAEDITVIEPEPPAADEELDFN